MHRLLYLRGTIIEQSEFAAYTTMSVWPDCILSALTFCPRFEALAEAISGWADLGRIVRFDEKTEPSLLSKRNIIESKSKTKQKSHEIHKISMENKILRNVNGKYWGWQ